MAIKISLTPITIPANRTPNAVWEQIQVEVRRSVKGQGGKVIKKAMEARVSNWDTRPTIRTRVSQPAGAIAAVTVFPTGAGRERWVWVSLGTSPRLIVSKSPMKPLRVRLNYRPKTTASGGYGRSSGYGGPVVHTNAVRRYKGIEARDFEGKIIKELDSILLLIIKAAVQRGSA